VAEGFLMRSHCTDHEKFFFIAIPISLVRAPYPVAPLATTEEQGEYEYCTVLYSLHKFSMVPYSPVEKEKFFTLT